MAILRVNATRTGQVLAAAGGADWADALAAALVGLAPGAPVIVLVHGYRFSWRRTRPTVETCAQALLYRAEPVAPSGRLRPARADWPARLGFAETGRRDGLCIAFGWDARRGRLKSLLMRGANDFAQVYRGAEAAGRALAQVLGRIAALRPDLRPGMLTHSLGARVALCAIRIRPDLRLGRIVMLAPAEYAGEARATLEAQDRAGGMADFLNVTSRSNALYDMLFALFAPPPATRGDRPLGWAGPDPRHARWSDLVLDHPAAIGWLGARGFAPGAPVPRLSHWHFYADPAAMALWRAILRAEPGWQVPSLAALDLPRPDTARWGAPRGPRLISALPRALGTPAVSVSRDGDLLAEA